MCQALCYFTCVILFNVVKEKSHKLKNTNATTLSKNSCLCCPSVTMSTNQLVGGEQLARSMMFYSYLSFSVVTRNKVMNN